MLNKIKHLNEIRKIYGLFFLIKIFLNRLISKERYNKCVYKKLLYEYREMLSNTYVSDFDEKQSEQINVWIFWWQGLENAPELVKKCIDLMKKNFNSENYSIKIITQDNIKEFCNFPEYIYKKVENKSITLTHFSDLIRANLLYSYGGLWIDSTVLVLENVEEDIFKNVNFFTIKYVEQSDKIVNSRWTGFFLYSKKGYNLFKFMNDFFLNYWEKNDYLIEYLLIDFVIALFYEKNEEFRKDLDSIPVNNSHIWCLLRELNKPFIEDDWNKFTIDTKFFKLSYKTSINKGNLMESLNGNKTYWGHIKCFFR